MTASASSLAQRLKQPGLVTAPGIYDMVSLRLADRMGFDALYVLLKTSIVFFLGAGALAGIDPQIQFGVEIVVMVVFSGLLFRWLFLGEERSLWRGHDATALVEDGHRCPPILIDQGLDDSFLAVQLHPERFEQVCADGQPLTLRRHAGYDHGYYFISTFMADHLAHHAQHLSA